MKTVNLHHLRQRVAKSFNRFAVTAAPKAQLFGAGVFAIGKSGEELSETLAHSVPFQECLVLLFAALTLLRYAHKRLLKQRSRKATN